MPSNRPRVTALALVAFAVFAPISPIDSAAADDGDASRLVAALLADTPMIGDLEALADRVGGRPTGSEANRRAVEWAAERFRDAGVAVRVEPFEMPMRWLERSARATIEGQTLGETEGKGVRFSPRIAAMPFSTATPSGGLTAPLVDAGHGGEEDFARLGDRAAGAVVLISTKELTDVPGLFREYTEAAAIERRAIAAGVAGVLYMGSRPGNQLYRHNASRGKDNPLPMAVVERDGAARALRLLADGVPLTVRLDLDLDVGGPYTSHNVVGEIRGGERPDEVVVVGAHLDSWGIGEGALDNGCNVALVIDLARQMRRLGLTPRRTIRFALFNGEEQGLWGSRGYAVTHAGELDTTVMASSYDIGSGRIVGFYTGGRPEIHEVLARSLAPVAGLGPFTPLPVPVVGTDNYDFMMEGVANLVADQESANYGPNYHSRSDTFDKVDQRQLRLNAAVAAAVTWGFANDDGVSWRRQSRAEVQELIDSTDLGDQMRTFGLMESWERGERGRRAESP